ncbi:MAG: ribosome silencing factor [Moorellales bacterium]
MSGRRLSASGASVRPWTEEIAWEMARVAMNAALDRKARDVLALDLRSISVVADYFVLASGSSTTQTQAIAQHIMEKMAEAGFPLQRSEGYASALWILLDYGPVVVHVFREEERRFYDLERLWGDAEVRTV